MTAGSIRQRMALVIIATTVVTSLLFGLITFVFAYNLEDRLFETELAREIGRQQAAWQRAGSLPAPQLPYVRIYRAGEALPADLAPQLGREPRRTEFPGADGRHYHIARFTLPGPGGGDALAVAESSGQLLVRPVRNSLIGFLAGLCLAVALVAGLIGWWLAHRALSPLSRLAAELAEAGQGVPRIDAGRYPANEIGVLATALAQAFERIRGFVAREQAFTRDASHELRTPLAVIGGAAELLALDPALPESARPALRRIETANADMAQALDLLLALAREGRAPARPAEPVALLPLIEKAVASAALRFPDSPVTVRIEVPAAFRVGVEPALLQLVLNNLVGNAFQHAAGSTLSLSAEAAGLVIADDGPGFSGVADPFAPFGKHSQSSGSGLGLAIVRRLCEAAGIGLDWRDAGAGRGAQFRLDFPAG